MPISVKYKHYKEIYNKHIIYPCKILEIGIGDGGSHLAWRNGGCDCYGIDKNPDTKKIEQYGVKVLIGSVMDKQFMQAVANKLKFIDVVIDDGGHRPYQQAAAFNVLWPVVIFNGWYCIEDLQMSDKFRWRLWELLGLPGPKKLLRKFYRQLNPLKCLTGHHECIGEVYLYPGMIWFRKVVTNVSIVNYNVNRC